MRTLLIMLTLALVVVGGTLLARNGSDDSETAAAPELPYTIDASDFVNPAELVVHEVEAAGLSEREVAGLLLMREEEKLARDVYLMLADMWGMNIFSNIARSEQTHMDAVKTLLNTYEIEDPVRNDSIGTFVNPDLTTLYSQLVERGKQSLNDALIVGATIEDLDIDDLERLMADTGEQNILSVYANLQKGSRNHLRAFTRQLDARGGSYKAQYISGDMYESIVSSVQEQGRAY